MCYNGFYSRSEKLKECVDRIRLSLEFEHEIYVGFHDCHCLILRGIVNLRDVSQHEEELDGVPRFCVRLEVGMRLQFDNYRFRAVGHQQVPNLWPVFFPVVTLLPRISLLVRIRQHCLLVLNE